MELVLWLVEIGLDGQSRSSDLMAISRPDGLGDLANAGLTLAEAKQLLAYVQRDVVAAQAGNHAQFRPGCLSCGGTCHVKDWRPHRIATVFGEVIPRLSGNPKNPLANQFHRDSTRCMIRAGFLDPESRRDLIELGRDGSVAHRLARRASALVLLDDGMSCGAVAKVLLLDDDTVRTWYRLYENEAIEGLASLVMTAARAA
jgi:hypothetical protein